mgnify:CR=1 FL=1
MESRYELLSGSISSMYHDIQKIERTEMAQYGLKGPHAQCLLAMKKHPEGITAARLCEVCDKDKAAVSRSILYLEQKNYLTREIPAEREGRQMAKHYRAPLALTEEGSRIAREIAEKVDRVLEAVSRGVSEEDRTIMYAALEQINRNLRALCEAYGDEEPR